MAARSFDRSPLFLNGWSRGFFDLRRDINRRAESEEGDWQRGLPLGIDVVVPGNVVLAAGRADPIGFVEAGLETIGDHFLSLAGGFFERMGDWSVTG
jgi:hypothetical protein